MKQFSQFIPLLLVICVTVLAAEPVWTVGYKGDVKHHRKQFNVSKVAGLFSNYLSRVLGTKVQTAPWQEAQGQNLFLITDASHAPAEIASELKGNRLDAFAIRYPYVLDGKKVCLIVSHDSHGYDLAVYYFLTKYVGVHWVGPGEIGEVVPVNPGWKMPEKISELQNPDFEMRHWGDYTFDHARPLLAGSIRMGFHHAFGSIYSPKKYAETDPDVYPLIEGKRRVPSVESVHTAGWQPCVGNPKVQDIAVKHVLDTFEKNPHMASVSLSVNDGAGNHCTCVRCTSMDATDVFTDPLKPNLSDRYFRFYNKVMKRVLEVNPNAYIAVLGYGPCGRPPHETKIHDRIVVFISTGADPGQFKSAGGASSLYHYHLDNAYPTIRHYPHMIARYLRESPGLGGMGYYAQVEHCWAAGGPKAYVLAHLLWDVDSDVDGLLDQYMRLAFGERAMAAMRAYFDLWEEIYDRETKDHHPYKTIGGWGSNHLKKFNYLKWDDLQFMDAAMAIAQRAQKTERQRTRLQFFVTYYRWLRSSAAQYLMTEDFLNRGWLGSRPVSEVMVRIEESLKLTEEFDHLWRDKIATDRTGWLLNQKPRVIKAIKQGRRYYDSLLVDPIRAELESHLAKGIGQALKSISVARKMKQATAVRFWNEELTRRPSLEMFIKPEINRIRGIVPKNLLVNPDFEQGEPGDLTPGNPPKLPGWWFYDRVGMVAGAKGVYEWNKKNSRNDSMCIGFGPSKYPGLRGFVKLKPGRYRFAFWYKTEGRELPVAVNLFRMSDDVKIETLTTATAVRKLTNDQYLKFLRRSWPPTDGKWQRVVQTFKLEKGYIIEIALEPFFMKDGAWTWFDDVEMVKLY
jgi:hypothetical protein